MALRMPYRSETKLTDFAVQASNIQPGYQRSETRKKESKRKREKERRARAWQRAAPNDGIDFVHIRKIRMDQKQLNQLKRSLNHDVATYSMELR